MSPTKQTGLRLPPDVVKWLKQKGKEDMRSMAAIVTLMIRTEIAREAKPKKAKPAKS